MRKYLRSIFIIITFTLAVIFITGLYSNHSLINYLLISYYDTNDGTVPPPHLYLKINNDIKLASNQCEIKTKKSITYDNVQICVEKNLNKNIKNSNNDSLMISSGNNGRQIVIMPATNFTSFLNSYNKKELMLKKTENFRKHFNSLNLKTMFNYDVTALNVTPDDLSILNNEIENNLILNLLERKKAILRNHATASIIKNNNIHGI